MADIASRSIPLQMIPYMFANSETAKRKYLCCGLAGTDHTDAVEDGASGVAKRTPEPNPADKINATKRALQDTFSKMYPAITLPPNKKAAAARWYQPLYKMGEAVGFDKEYGVNVMREAAKRMNGLTVSAPASLLSSFMTVVSESARTEGVSQEWSPLGANRADTKQPGWSPL